MFQRHFQCGNSFSRVFLTADKGGSSSQAAPTVAELTQQVTALKADKTQLETDLAAANQKATDADAAKTKAEADLAGANQKVTALEADKTRLEGEVTAANQKVTDAETAKVKAEADLKTADERAETKLREIDAKNRPHAPPQTRRCRQPHGRAGKNRRLSARAPRSRFQNPGLVRPRF
jgi:chromosome segregation ATPase